MAGMWIAHIEVQDDEAYAEYLKDSSEVIAAYDRAFIARGGRYRQMEGKEYPRNVVVRFPTYDRASSVTSQTSTRPSWTRRRRRRNGC